jgi:hypothetical protein
MCAELSNDEEQRAVKATWASMAKDRTGPGQQAQGGGRRMRRAGDVGGGDKDIAAESSEGAGGASASGEGAGEQGGSDDLFADENLGWSAAAAHAKVSRGKREPRLVAEVRRPYVLRRLAPGIHRRLPRLRRARPDWR